MMREALKDFLDQKALQYEHPFFLEEDPIQLPHRFHRKEDIEISGFLVALIAWGNRKSILKSGDRLLGLIDNAPYEYVLGHTHKELKTLRSFVHRTFQGDDLPFMITALRRLYEQEGGLEGFFNGRTPQKNITLSPLQSRISELKSFVFEKPHQKRTEKHLADPAAGSAAKRINMFLRWMVRPSDKGVDFGLWRNIGCQELSCPLDVHTASVARKLGLIQRKQNDSRTVIELDRALSSFDPRDPVKYDFALFGLGAYEKF